MVASLVAVGTCSSRGRVVGVLTARELPPPFPPLPPEASLPAGASALVRLAVLDLSTNKLQALPAALGDLSALEELALAHNQLAALPSELSRLTSLRSLLLDDNR